MSESAFLSQLEGYVTRAARPDRLQRFREQSWHQVQILGLPTSSHDAFRFVPLRELYASSFAMSASSSKPSLPASVYPRLVFVDGIFSSELSDISALDLVVTPLDEALLTSASFLEPVLHRFVQEEKDPFALLNLALQPQGILLYVPPHVRLDTPLHCLYVETAASLTAPRLHIALGTGSHLRLLATSHSLHEAPSLALPFTECFLEAGARLEIQDTPASHWCMATLRAVLKQKASLTITSFTQMSRSYRAHMQIALKGEGAEATLRGLSSLPPAHTAHIRATVTHEAPHTRSMQLFKGILEEKSRFGFSGKIEVRPIAQKTQAYQLHKSLLLGSGALVHSQPNLEIGADDVKATHGSTIAQLDPHALFYLQTRGLHQKAAQEMLLQGFCEEIERERF